MHVQVFEMEKCPGVSELMAIWSVWYRTKFGSSHILATNFGVFLYQSW